MDCQFSFGPNRSYFCSAGPGSLYAWSANTLPPKLAALLENPAHPQALATPHDVAFPMEAGMHAICWKTTSGQDWYEDGCLGPSYARLARFMKTVATTGAHTTRTVFGPNASFFSMSPSGFCSQNIPLELEDNIHSCSKIRRPTSVSLGAQASYIVLYNDGNIVFDLRGQYPLVESMLRNTQDAAARRGLMYVALNPFIAGEFYAVYGDGSASWNFPTTWTADVTPVSRQIKPIPISAPVVSPGGIGMTAQPAGIPPPAPVEVALGGTGPLMVQPTAAVERSVSMTMSGGAPVFEAVGHATPTPPPPAYVPAPVQVFTAQPGAAAPVQVLTAQPTGVAQPLGAAAPAPAAHKFNWGEAFATGLKVVQAVETGVKVVEGAEKAFESVEKVFGGDNQQQQQQGQNSFDFNMFNQQQQQQQFGGNGFTV